MPALQALPLFIAPSPTLQHEVSLSLGLCWVQDVTGIANRIGSHHDALESYERAVALAPSRLIHRVELGRTLHRLGRKEQARSELEVSSARVYLLLLARMHFASGGRHRVAGAIMHSWWLDGSTPLAF